MSPPRGCFVTGTDTGVGKTVVACAIVRGLRARGIDVGAMKPIETGVGPDGPLDAAALREATGDRDPLDLVCPLQLALPAAPTVAATAERRVVDVAALDAAFETLGKRHDYLVVEGAGGLLVPVTTGLTMADLAARWSLPLVVVARTALGTINHTRLTVEVARARGLDVRGIVLSHATGRLSDADAANLEALREAPGAKILGEIPYLPTGTLPDTETLDLDALLLGSSAAR